MWSETFIQYIVRLLKLEGQDKELQYRMLSNPGACKAAAGEVFNQAAAQLAPWEKLDQ